MEKRARRAFGIAAVAGIVLLTSPQRAEATYPDPVIASLISLSSTLVPIGITTSLWVTERGTEEGLRFDVGMAMLGVGAVIGPSVGQIYASGGTDAVVTFVLRAITGSVMMVGIGFKTRGDENNQGAGTALAVLGGVPTLILALWDIFGAASSATATRRAAGHGPKTGLMLSPEILSIARCGPIPCAIQ